MSQAPVVSSLTIFPVKSLGGMAVSEAVVEPRGFKGDRRFMIVDPDGAFVTRRECHAMAMVGARIDGDEVVLERSGASDLAFATQETARTPMSVHVWRSSVDAERVGPDADRWLTEALGRPVVLVGMPESSTRPVNPAYDRGADEVSFADGYPYMVISEESLADLNRRLDDAIPMVRFRPNITVAGVDEAYSEDRWQRFRLGTVGFEGVKPCARCVMITVDPSRVRSGERMGQEPMRTLATYRTRTGGVMFGMNAVPDAGGGSVRVGDAVSVERTGAIDVRPE